MKICPKCQAAYEYEMSFCLQDGTPLIRSGSTSDVTQVIENKTPDPELTEFRGDQTLQMDDKTLNFPQQAQSSSAEENTVLKPQQIPVPTERMNFVNTEQTPPVTDRMNVAVPTDEPRFQPIFSPPPSSSKTGWIMAIILGVVAVFAIPIIGLMILNPFTQNDESSRTNSGYSSSNRVGNSSNSASSVNSSNSNISNRSGSNGLNSIFPANAVNKPNRNSSSTQSNVNRVINKPPFQPDNSVIRPDDKTPPVPKVISDGVVNGKASHLVKPPYPPAARAVRAAGTVNVQVLIDEDGNVISAQAVSGHVLLRAAAESAARSSKFNPTTLSGQRVKVTGVISYNFTP